MKRQRRTDVPVDPRYRYWYLLKHLPEALGMTSRIKPTTPQEAAAQLDAQLDKLFAANGLTRADVDKAIWEHSWYGVPLPKLTKRPEPVPVKPVKPVKPTAAEQRQAREARLALLHDVAYEFGIDLHELRHVLGNIKPPPERPSTEQAIQSAVATLNAVLDRIKSEPDRMPNGKRKIPRIRATPPEPAAPQTDGKRKIPRIRASDRAAAEPSADVVPITSRQPLQRERGGSHWMFDTPAHSATVLPFSMHDPRQLAPGQAYRGEGGRMFIRGAHPFQPPVKAPAADAPDADSWIARHARRARVRKRPRR